MDNTKLKKANAVKRELVKREQMAAGVKHLLSHYRVLFESENDPKKAVLSKSDLDDILRFCNDEVKRLKAKFKRL